MSELDPDAIRDEAADRLADLAIANAIAGRSNDHAIEALVTAAAANEELLAKAQEVAELIAEHSSRAPVVRAVADLADARRHVAADD